MCFLSSIISSGAMLAKHTSRRSIDFIWTTCRFRNSVNRMGNTVHGVNSQIRSPCEKNNGETPAVSLIYDRVGNRKYLTVAERRRFLRAVEAMAPELRTFCRVLSYTGARISEVLALTPAHIDASARMVVLECLKKRRRGIFRAIPLPTSLIDELETVHHLSDGNSNPGFQSRRLWPWCRTIAWRRVKEGMDAAHLVGPQATPKGLRHAFAVTALQGGVPITMVKRWLGHARLSTTEIYANAIGPEEQAVAVHLWNTF
jgi:integrase/recombinase XerD